MILAPTPSHFENSKEIINAIKYRIYYFLLGEEGRNGIGGAVEGGMEKEEARRGAMEGGEENGGEGGRKEIRRGREEGNEGLKEEGKRIIERGENKRDRRFLRRWVETQSVVYFLEGNEDV